ncbi:hypothetical protein HYW60_01790 [Candidatus Kaiserbacteria bacterium]|nr:hypothetical protein [Candidatus Kaiserbacteria bacterium]
MNADISKKELDEKIQDRFKELPKVVQDAITSVGIQKQLRELADTKHLHLDQWQLLENNVMLTLLGFQPPEELAKNLKADLEVSDEVTNSLASDVSRIVFEPIRQELERELEHPEAKEKEVSSVEATRAQVLASTGDRGKVIGEREENTSVIAAPLPVVPATPPPPQGTEKAVRGPTSGAYRAGEPSSARKDIHDDPYREPPQ